jgi:hypothetical protein
MGFNKRFIAKENLELALVDLNRLLAADALIIKDEWSSKFIEAYQKLIADLNKTC